MSKVRNEFRIDGTLLQELLGDDLPDIGPSAVGRIRLMRALQSRFGKRFRDLPGPRKALKDFDEQTKDIREAARIKKGMGNA